MKDIKEILKESFKAIDTPELEFEYIDGGCKKPDYIVLDPTGTNSTYFEYYFTTEQNIKQYMEDTDPEDDRYATYEKILNLKYGECQSVSMQYQYHLYYIRISK